MRVWIREPPELHLPSLANNGDFSGESVAVAGQAGTTSPFAGIDMDQIRQNAELNPNGGFGGPDGGGPGGGGPGGGGPGGGGPGGGGGGGGFGGGGRGGFGGGGGRGGFSGGGGRGFGNFRNLKANQPHGAFYWNGMNSALNAEPFSVNGETGAQPSYAQNRFGFTFLGSPYIPGILKHDTKDVIFANLSGQRSSSPIRPVRYRADGGGEDRRPVQPSGDDLRSVDRPTIPGQFHPAVHASRRKRQRC